MSVGKKTAQFLVCRLSSTSIMLLSLLFREHFPFFRAAPDGWKNTVRHNLCFSSSFEKIAGWVCADGHRRSCLWKLTCQGRKKFRTEVHGLSDELLRILRRSMTKPGTKCLQVCFVVAGGQGSLHFLYFVLYQKSGVKILTKSCHEVH